MRLLLPTLFAAQAAGLLGILSLAVVACAPDAETTAPVAPAPAWQVEADALLAASDMRWDNPRGDAGIVTQDAYIGTVRAIYYGGYYD